MIDSSADASNTQRVRARAVNTADETLDRLALELKQTAEGDKRHLEIPGGAVIVEELIGTDTRSYAYAILSGPLPVENYRSILSVAEAGEGAVVHWTATFEATADGAEAAVAGIYEAGMAALVEKLGN